MPTMAKLALLQMLKTSSHQQPQSATEYATKIKCTLGSHLYIHIEKPCKGEPYILFYTHKHTYMNIAMLTLFS